MNDTQQKYIGWFLIVLLFTGYITINNIIFLKIIQQESEDNINVLTEKIDEFRMSLEVHQSRVEKKIFDLKRGLHTQCEQGDGSSRHKNLARLLLLVVKMKNSLLREAKFDNHINSIKPLISELDDPEIENAVNELESLKEVDTLRELKLFFEKTIAVINYNKSTLSKKIISNWIRIQDKNDPLRAKFALAIMFAVIGIATAAAFNGAMAPVAAICIIVAAISAYFVFTSRSRIKEFLKKSSNETKDHVDNKQQRKHARRPKSEVKDTSIKEQRTNVLKVS
ncbi:hypothetical protein [Wolbachia endosymbiont of Psylliodes chrysocephala]|uniref:hypothetical protein n=1 Tax=Wolbachia endosymbiont of Psylliodes chrysocephala TaxID=2883236 RepID=UPI0020A0F61B|nr:hypothetical protein [Wolbachia endosymbiont of Psylliodes chrysocephala]